MSITKEIAKQIVNEVLKMGKITDKEISKSLLNPS